MSPRPYRQSRRAEAAEQTRRRIVKATAELHAEKGIGATTLREIAARADVGLGTVYHHFPSYEHVIAACGAYSWEMIGPPRPEAFDGIDDAAERIRLLVAEIFAVYQRMPAFGRIRGEREQFRALDEGFRHEEAHRRALIDAALRGVDCTAAAHAVAFALLDFCTWEHLVGSGLTQDAAVDEVSNLLLIRLKLKGTSA